VRWFASGPPQEESTEVWLRRHNLPPLAKKPLGKKITHFLLCHKIDVAGQSAGQERIDWGNTIFIYCAVAIIILFAVFCLHAGMGQQIP